jgi:hypothetical protein
MKLFGYSQAQLDKASAIPGVNMVIGNLGVVKNIGLLARDAFRLVSNYRSGAHKVVASKDYTNICIKLPKFEKHVKNLGLNLLRAFPLAFLYFDLKLAIHAANQKNVSVVTENDFEITPLTNTPINDNDPITWSADTN